MTPRSSRYSYSLRRPAVRWLGVAASVLIVLANIGTSDAAALSTTSVALSDPRPSQAAVTYAFTASGVSLSAIKCIKEVYSTTSSGTTVPASMVTTGAALDTTNSNYMPTPGAWTVNAATNGTILLTDATGQTPASATARKVIYTGITNGVTPDTKFFLQFSTYTNTDCATGPIDNTTVDYIFTNGSTLSLSVDPTLTFTVNAVASGQGCDGTTTTAASTATTIPFGSVSSASNAIVCQDLTGSTNATNGYTIYARYTSKPTNAIAQTIADTSGSNAAPATFSAAGTEAYGYTTNDATLGTGTANRFTNPTQNWAAMTTSNAEVAYEPTGVNSTTYRIGHQVGVSLTTHPGSYVTTVIYTITPVY